MMNTLREPTSFYPELAECRGWDMSIDEFWALPERERDEMHHEVTVAGQLLIDTIFVETGVDWLLIGNVPSHVIAAGRGEPRESRLTNYLETIGKIGFLFLRSDDIF